MPVTVKELIVRATVVDTTTLGGKIEGPAREIRQEERDQLITDCVDQVLQILKDQKER
ncbi:MAG TPA: DUF5908 family protein [Cytophagaceae bacterium]|jgi:hypothetical protein|nr:DUF5908 family protein [Cytophagaceae bacterium]